MLTDLQDFEKAIKSLKARLEKADKKVSASEMTIKSLTKGRDGAQQQLAQAYLGTEDLRNESLTVQDEILSLKKQLRKITKQHEKRIDKLTGQESELRQKIERREKAVNEMASIAKELWKTRHELSSKTLAEQDKLIDVRQESQAQRVRRPQSIDNAQGMQSGHRSVSLCQPANSDVGRFVSTSQLHSGQDHGAARQPRIQSVQDGMDGDLTKRASFLSFMDGDEVAKLQLVLDQEKARLANVREKSIRDSTIPRKSSLRMKKQGNGANRVQYEDKLTDTSRKSGQPKVRDDDHLTTEIDITGPNELTRDMTQQSVASRRSSVRRRSALADADDLTSAFILPDITLSEVGTTAQKTQASALEASEKSAKTTIQRPTPVSDRAPVTISGPEDPTLRPAQPPALALATVLKALEDELTQIRSELANLEARYHSHDPALSKRERKRVFSRMQKLLTTAEARSDQIYALYDVLEGQKAVGMTMREEEVEVTLQQVGVELSILRAGATESAKKQLSGQIDGVNEMNDDSTDASDDEAVSDEGPWEGFDPTRTMDSILSHGPYRR